jgi:type I restriction enzyme S subunit
MSAIIDYRGKTPRKTITGIPLVTAKIVKGGRIEEPDEFVDPSEYDEWMRRGLPRPGDVLFTTEAPLGEVAQLDGRKVALAQRLICLRGKPDLLDNTFLKFLMQSAFVQEQLKARATGTTVLGIRQSELRRVQLLLPSLREQRAIAAILGALDNKIELNRRMNETLEETARALFKSWFVDFDPVHANRVGRPPVCMDAATASLFPSALAGSIPTGWTARSLYDSALFINGAAYRDFHFCSSKEGLPIIKIAELKNGITAQTKFTNTELADKYRLKNRDILFSWSGNPDTSIDAFVWHRGPAWLNQHIFRVTPHEGEWTFAYLLLKHLKPVFAEIARNKQTTGLGHVTAQDMKRLTVVAPPRAVLEAFERLAGPIVERWYQNLLESDLLASLRDLLLPKLLSGELRVRDAEREVEKVA